MQKCIDVSAWQGVIPASVWKKNKKEIPCAILRSSYTLQAHFSLYKDKTFDENIKNASEAGMKIGAYHYSQAISEAEAKSEAEFTVKVLKPYKGKISLPIAFDWEFGGRLNGTIASKMGKQRCKQICDAFCRAIRAAGFTPMVYANLSTLNGYIASDIYKEWPIWVAQYNSKCDYKHPAYMWQYTSNGSVPGITGRVDMNYLYGQTVASEPSKATTCPYVLPNLPKRGWFASGDKGEQVKRMQRFLNWYGDYGLAVDGDVGRKTIEAVKKFEGREKLKPVDGLFGEKCLARAKTVKR